MKWLGILLELLERVVAWVKLKKVDSVMTELKTAESEEQRQNAAKSIANLISRH